MEGRAAPIKSRMPCLTCRTIKSGEVKRPTPTTGFDVSCLIPRIKSSCAASGLKREVPRTGLPGAMGKIPDIGKLRMQANEIAQLRIGKSLLARHFIKRKPHRHGATVAHLILAHRQIISFSSRARFSSEPPYSSLR